MNRIERRFEQLRQQQRKALIPFMTAGSPHPDHTVDLMHTLVRAGADLIELGIPFSDPMADGPVIQLANEQALHHGVTPRDVLAMVSRFREQDQQTPVILMGYLNPLEVMGYATFAALAEESGVDGVITVDLPPEEAEEMLDALRPREISPIFLISPTTSPSRIETIARSASGFIYYVSMKGITGSGGLDLQGIERSLVQIRNRSPLPVGVGFGIKDGETAAAVSAFADAVVVGTALVQRLLTAWEEEESGQRLHDVVESFISQLRTAIDR
ncbi:MAG: tryptophan synthase subunit alpha [Gammaproteobacteria bacterium]|nr:tryptophan synthase subunit alpha [Gammaproteobacteria bacterium]